MPMVQIYRMRLVDFEAGPGSNPEADWEAYGDPFFVHFEYEAGIECKELDDDDYTYTWNEA